jgi:hypothetical protein
MIDFRNHYWVIAGANVYFSVSNTIIAPNDPDYVAWLNVNQPSQIASEADLAVTLQPQNILPAWMFNATDTFIQPTPTTYTHGQLAAYAADARFRKASGGCTIGGKPYLTDPVSRNTVSSAHDYAVANPGHITDWKLADGTFIQLNETQLAHVLQEMATFVQSCFTCESTTVTNINGGSVTTLAEVDAAFAAISNVFP